MARLLILSGLLLGLVYLTSAYEFYVGGKDGWVLKPAESYKLWAEKMRFQVNDTLVFKYKKGEDSVLVVKKEDYDSCNTSNPIKKMDDGDSVFVLDRPGAFFFISGVDDHCGQGEKLEVVVMADRKPPVSPPPPSPPPAAPMISSAEVKFAARFLSGLLAMFFVAAVLGSIGRGDEGLWLPF